MATYSESRDNKSQCAISFPSKHSAIFLVATVVVLLKSHKQNLLVPLIYVGIASAEPVELFLEDVHNQNSQRNAGHAWQPSSV